MDELLVFLIPAVVVLGILLEENWGNVVKAFRELRDNNPCGVNQSKSHEATFIQMGLLQLNSDGSPKMDGPLYMFVSMLAGLTAAAFILKDITLGSLGSKNLDDVAYHWTGSTSGYTGADLAKALGGSYVDGSTPVDTSNISDLLYALTYNENSEEAADLFPDSLYSQAAQRAGVS